VEKESTAGIVVTNMLGQIVAQHSAIKIAGHSKQVVEMSGLPGNIYWVKIIVNGGQKVFKVLKMDE
jgi:hypothetical protein